MRNIIDWKASRERKSIKTRGFSWRTLAILTLTFAVFVTERSLSHVTQAYWALAAAVGEGVTLLRVKLCGGDHFRQLLHVGGLDVHNVWETSIKEQPWLSRVLLTFSTRLTALMVDKRQLWWALTNLFSVHTGLSNRQWEDTEAAVGDLQVPQVDPQVVGGDERLEVRVDRDGVDVVGVCIAENTSGCSLDHQIHRLQHRHLFRKNLGEGMKRNTENNHK